MTLLDADREGHTAVDAFAKRHEEHALPANERYYRDLIPLDVPSDGEQYGFEVDLDSCTGCKACVTACHSLNGLDDDESWRSVGFLQGAGKVAFQQTVTTACHHCVDPACLSGCPVDAYEKDPVTGIVAHLDDQCIGCAYCTLTCPYEVPVYNKRRGIVRKCDMCQGRLAAGEAPACVQACPNGAITIEIVDVAAVAAAASLPGAAVVPGAPPSSITAPTTVYRRSRDGGAPGTGGPGWAAVASPTRLGPASGSARSTGRAPRPPLESRPDAGSNQPAAPRGPASSHRPATSHTPLAVMLVLTQLSVGALVADLVLPGGRSRPFDAAVAVAAGALALGASVLHLGRPRYAYRAVIGLRHSWLSREVLTFGAFTAAAAAYAAGVWLDRPVAVLGVAAAVFGVAGVACSVMIYASTHRPSWRAPKVAAQFTLTSAVAGLVAVEWASSIASTPVDHAAAVLALVALLALAEAALERPARRRLVLALAGTVALPAALAMTSASPAGLTVLLVATVAHEMAARSAFFTTAGPPR